MATKSITKDINIKDKKSANALINALEKGAAKNTPEVKYARPCIDVKRDQIKSLFGKGE